MDTNTLVEKYIQIRDAKARVVAHTKEHVAKLDDVLDRIEAQLMLDFKAQGIESVRTEAGTAYKSLRTSATVSDWDRALDFIKSSDLWNMLDKRVNKTAVAEYIDENKDLPPGITWREEHVINVRRA